jgi:hypothetical protein
MIRLNLFFSFLLVLRCHVLCRSPGGFHAWLAMLLPRWTTRTAKEVVKQMGRKCVDWGEWAR